MAGFRRALRPLLSRQENNAEIAEIAGKVMPPARHASLAPAARPPSGPSCVTVRGPGPSAATSALRWGARAAPARRAPARGATGTHHDPEQHCCPCLGPSPDAGPGPEPGADPGPGRGPVPPGAADVAGREALWARGLTRCGPARPRSAQNTGFCPAPRALERSLRDLFPPGKAEIKL